MRTVHLSYEICISINHLSVNLRTVLLSGCIECFASLEAHFLDFLKNLIIFVYVCVCVWTHACASQRLVLAIFLNHSPPYCY